MAQTNNEKSVSGISYLILGIIVIILILIAWSMLGNKPSPGTPSQPATSRQETQKPNNPTSAPQSGRTVEFNIDSKPFEFSLKEIKVKKGDTVKINLTNTEGFHDWVVDEFNARTPKINAGQNASIEFVADKTGTFEYYCSVGNHRQMGMVGKLIVE